MERKVGWHTAANVGDDGAGAPQLLARVAHQLLQGVLGRCGARHPATHRSPHPPHGAASALTCARQAGGGGGWKRTPSSGTLSTGLSDFLSASCEGGHWVAFSSAGLDWLGAIGWWPKAVAAGTEAEGTQGPHLGPLGVVQRDVEDAGPLQLL